MSDQTFTLKKSRTIEERIETLKNRNLIIDNFKEFETYINYHTTYYHLTGYRFILERYDKISDNYNNHTASELIALYRIDNALSSYFFNETRAIEQSLRTRIANICNKDDMVTFKFDHENELMILEENYCYKKDKQTLFIADYLYRDRIANNIYNDLNNVTEDPVIRHHINNYRNIIPLWVIINYISFGTLINLIMCFTSYKLNQLMKGNTLSKKGQSTYYPLLKSIQMLRNKISHHNNILGKESAFIISGYPKSIYQAGIEGIEAWSKLLLNDTATPQRIRKDIKKIIEEINEDCEVSFTTNIIINKNIR